MEDSETWSTGDEMKSDEPMPKCHVKICILRIRPSLDAI